MIKEKGKKTNPFSAVHLYLELKEEYLTGKDKAILRKYGASSTGDTISRHILIPSDLPLHNLHHAIQRLFGWQNSHLRKFVLPEDVFDSLTKGTVRGWADYVGILFQPPGELNHDFFWDDDYRSGSIRTWLKQKYTGPYSFRGEAETYEWAQNDLRLLFEHFPAIEVRESFAQYRDKNNSGADDKQKVVRKAPLIDLTLEEMNNAIYIESGSENLLERLEAAKILSFRDGDDEVSQDQGLFPVTDKLFYHYDFGDNWIVTISKEKDCERLLENGFLSEDELSDAVATVLKKHIPVCLHQDGCLLMDDVGGLHGFIDFLTIIHEGKDMDERDEMLAWAQGQGWRRRKISNKLVL